LVGLFVWGFFFVPVCWLDFFFSLNAINALGAHEARCVYRRPHGAREAREG
jgi:hypothetical protein